ncbi:phage holin family protein [Sphingomonas bacterium]|uniref:phage holin family protein n=1 Tax=Sphingomonas bacterium TaxID=1895847 RepID=UPI0020C69276|nr:phage holin family protein [Sphingomonas bacterium]
MEDESLASLVGRTIEDARAVVSAEIALYKARAGERITAYKGAVTFFAIAGVLALCGFIALLVGLILSLATLIGPGLATAAVVLTVFALAGVLAMIGKGRLAPPKLDGAA